MLRSAQGVVVDAAALSDPGRDPEKQVNEDAVAVSETAFGVAALVCDGMGGHERGELASRTARDRILEVLRTGGDSVERLMSSAIERAHAEVYSLGGSAPMDARPGSTAVVLIVFGREAVVCHVGDSRAYRIRARRLERLTRDHSVVEALLAAGAITIEQANAHPDANRITRALGIAPEIEPELSPPVHVEAGDVFVLCSDGLSDLVTDMEIAELVSGSPSPEAACDSLVALANQRGGHDNISVAVLRVLALGSAQRARETVSVALATDHGGRDGDTATHKVPPDAATVVQQPGFTVVMGADGIPRTLHSPADPGRGPAPTLVDPMIAAEGARKTLPHDEAPATPANIGAGVAPPGTQKLAPVPVAAPPPSPAEVAPKTVEVRPFPQTDTNSSRPTLDAMDAPSLRPPGQTEVKLIIWGALAACALIVVIVFGWWALR